MQDLLKESLTIYATAGDNPFVDCLVYWIFVILGTLDLDTFDLGGDLRQG